MRRKIAIVVMSGIILLTGLVVTAPSANAATGTDLLDYYSATYKCVTSKNFVVSKDGANVKVTLLSSSLRNDERLRVRLWVGNRHTVETRYRTIPEGHYWTFFESLRKGDVIRVEGSNPFGNIKVRVTY